VNRTDAEVAPDNLPMPGGDPSSRQGDTRGDERGFHASLWVVIACGLVVTAAPLLLLLQNRDWFFTSEGYIDPWVYVGYFHQYLDPDYRPTDYKLARLPWILSGFVATQLFTPVTAAFVLHAVFLCATPLALFAVMQVLFRLPVLSVVTALCLGFYTQGHGSGSWDYHNTSSGALYLATVALSVVPAAIRGHRLLLLVVGGMAAVTVHNNITFANLLPSLVYLHLRLAYLRTGNLPSVRALVARTAWALAGVLSATVLLGFVNVMAGREFVFFADLGELLQRYLTNPAFQAGRPLSSTDWVLTARHLAVPAAILLAGIASVVVNRRWSVDADRRVASALVEQYLPIPLLWVVWQTAGHTALDWDYMAYGLVPTGFLAFGGLLRPGWPIWCERRWMAVTLASVIVLSACVMVDRIPGTERLATSMQPLILVGGCLLLLVPLFAYLWRPSVVAAMCLLAMFAFDNRVIGIRINYSAADRCKVQPAMYDGIVNAASWLMTVDPFYNRTRIWADENEVVWLLEGCSARVVYMAYSLATMASAGYLTRTFPMPGINRVPDESLLDLKRDSIVVIATNVPAQLDAWSHRLEALGLTHSEIESHRVPILSSGFTLYAWSVSPRSP
jgi:hypothetical protein